MKPEDVTVSFFAQFFEDGRVKRNIKIDHLSLLGLSQLHKYLSERLRVEKMYWKRACDRWGFDTVINGLLDNHPEYYQFRRDIDLTHNHSYHMVYLPHHIHNIEKRMVEVVLETRIVHPSQWISLNRRRLYNNQGFTDQSE